MSKTPREDYLGMARGEKPDHLFFLGGYNPAIYGEGRPVQYMLYGPAPLTEYDMAGGRDLWGVDWILAESGGAQPDPEQHLIEDIEQWRDSIQIPDFDSYDWEAIAKKDMETNVSYGMDQKNTLKSFWIHSGYVTQLTNMMGFSEAMMALLESPEDVCDLFELMNDFYCKVLDKVIPLYKPDTLHLFDTFAGSNGPFYSVDLYKELVFPFHKKEAEIAGKYGLPVEMHCAGYSEKFLDVFVEPLNVRYWTGAEVCNDIPKVMRDHPQLVMCGAWQQTDKILSESCTEAEFKKSVTDVIDQYYPTGRFAWFDCVLANERNADDAAKKNEWLRQVIYQV